VYDDPLWAFRAEGYPATGVCRLRVWDAIEHGHFAVVSNLYGGLSVTNAAQDIWKALVTQYGLPFGLAEHWPDGAGTPEAEHVDLVYPGRLGRPAGWEPLWPVAPGSAHEDFRLAWWDRFGDQITAG